MGFLGIIYVSVLLLLSAQAKGDLPETVYVVLQSNYSIEKSSILICADLHKTATPVTFKEKILFHLKKKIYTTCIIVK